MHTQSTLSKTKQGFSLIEILIVIALVGIFASITAVSGRRVMQSQDEVASAAILRQSLARATTLASSRGEKLKLYQSTDGKELYLDLNASPQDRLASFELPNQITVNWPELLITEAGFVEAASLSAALANPIILQGPRESYSIDISIMGELKVEVQ